MSLTQPLTSVLYQGRFRFHEHRKPFMYKSSHPVKLRYPSSQRDQNCFTKAHPPPTRASAVWQSVLLYINCEAVQRQSVCWSYISNLDNVPQIMLITRFHSSTSHRSYWPINALLSIRYASESLNPDPLH